MFTGDAEEAMTFYVSLFDNSEITSIKHHEDGEMAGKVFQAEFTLAGREFYCIDSPPVHDFDFTPSMSIYVECEDQAELDDAFQKLADGGQIMMPRDNYGFSRRFGWTTDRFGVSWQLNLL
jgi:predicted 3-demethylubiquinone-9 3-methyltransferase (glyoxalase superfamily)